MSVRSKLFLYLAVLHLVIGVMAYYAIGHNSWLLVAELLLLLSAYLAFRIFRKLVAPLELLGRGVAALSDQDFSVKISPTGSPEMDRLGRVYNQMIDQLRSERISNRQREEFLDQLVTAAEVGIVILDFDGGVQRVNPWIEERQRRLGDFHDTVIEPASRLAAGEHRVFVSSDNRRLHTEYASFVDRGFERGFLIIHDVTADLLTAEKEAYGKVIRMMAHEVNNSNAGIVSLLRTILGAAREKAPDLGELAVEYLPAVISRTENMTAFMRNFARVVRLPKPRLRRTDLNALVERSTEVMSGVLREDAIELHYEPAAGPTDIFADAAQLEQVIINAITNARESIGREGRIVITTALNPTRLVIADNGAGIDPADRDRLFTPFFSTKPSGQGVGLTLTRDILEGHGAQYQLRTESDGWTRLRIVFS